MTVLLSLGAIVAAFGMLLWYGHTQRKAGVDKAENAANKEALHDILEATKPATVVELEHVRKSWKRD